VNFSEPSGLSAIASAEAAAAIVFVMKPTPIFYCAFFLILGFVPGCRSQDVVADVAKSHIDGNVPEGKLFDEYLTRNLTAYFCKDAKDCRVQYELLREGPTQTGISYPKYYLWTKTWIGGTVMAGAVRVAAIDKKEFRMTDFLSREEIVMNPSRVSGVFPAPLVETIVRRAQEQ
jgi:hypothetical protein